MMETNTTEMPARSAKDQFDRQSPHYNAQWNTWTENTLRWMLDHAACRPDDRVLDVATGTGFTALAFAPHVASVVGLDVSEGMLRQAQAYQQAQSIGNVSWQEGAAEALPFADAAFSLVTCRVAPHHFLSIPQFLSEVRRVLQPGGRFVLADTCVPDNDTDAGTNGNTQANSENGGNSETNVLATPNAIDSANAMMEAANWQNHVEVLRDPSHVRNLSPREWRQALEAAGLMVAELEGPVGDVAITLNDWIVKAGCVPEQASAVRQAFASSPAKAKEVFQIQDLPDGDTRFVWLRVAAKAVKNS